VSAAAFAVAAWFCAIAFFFLSMFRLNIASFVTWSIGALLMLAVATTLTLVHFFG
jgi:hypothetical protein